MKTHLIGSRMKTAQQQVLMDDLDTSNQECLEALNYLKNKDNSEKLEELVSNLQDLMSKRQKSLSALIADDSFTQRDYLERQLELTLSFKVKAKLVMKGLQSDLNLGKQNQRQLNVYKSIDSDR